MQLKRINNVTVSTFILVVQYHYLVEECVERPREEEADPTDGNHDPHMSWGQLVRDPIDVDQLHVVLDAQLCGDGQPGKTNSQ